MIIVYFVTSAWRSSLEGCNHEIAIYVILFQLIFQIWNL